MDPLSLAVTAYGLRESHLSAIGAVCVGWSVLEMNLATLVARLVPITGTRDFTIFTGTTDFKTKLDMARAYAHERIQDRKAFERLDRFLDAIDNQLRPERNRIVHDWWPSAERPTRTQFKPRYSKKPFKAPELVVESRIHMDAEEVRQFAFQMAMIAAQLIGAAALYSSELRGPAEPWPDIFSGPQEELSRFLDRIAKAPKPQPRSSRK